MSQKLLTTYVLLLVGFVHSLFAQTQDSLIVVKAVNQLDETIAEALVSLVESGKIKRQVKTDRQGVAGFSGLAAGKYKIVIAANGFKEYQSEIIAIAAGEHRTIGAVLEIAPVESKVEVGGDDEADVGNFGMSRVLRQSAIDKLPDDPQDIERILRQMAGQSVTGEDLPITVDGFQGGRVPPKQAIQQVRFNQNIFSAEYEGPYGGGIEIFTKTDVEKFSGGVGFNFADSRLNAANPFIGQTPPAKNRRYSLFLTGPLAGKEAMFTLSAHHAENDSSAAINAVVLDSALQPAAFREFSLNSIRGDNVQFSVKADLNKKHKLFFNCEFENQKGTGQGVGDFILPSRAYDHTLQNHTLQISETYLINENVVNQTRFQILFSKNKNFGGADGEPAINVLDAFFGGGSQTNSLNRRLRFEFSNDTTWQTEKYGLGFGWKIRGVHVNRFSKSNFGGAYTFAGRIAPVLDADNNIVTNASGNVLTTQISSLESYRRTLLFRQLGFSNQQIRNLGGGASQFTISGGAPEISANQFDAALYVQNSYKINKQLALSFGARYENQTNVNSNFNFSPRFGVIWSPKVNKKKSLIYALPKVSAGFGLFYSRFDVNNILGIKQADNANRAEYVITDTNILDFYSSIPSLDSLARFALPKTKKFIDAETQTPLQKLFNVNIYKKLPSNFSVSFSYSRTANLRQLITRNVNAPLAGTFDLLNPASAIYPFGGDEGFIYGTSSGGKSLSDWYSVRLGVPSKKYLDVSVLYSFWKFKNDLVSGSGSPFDPYDFSREFGSGERDGRHSVSLVASSDLPFGISVTNFFNFASGTRFNITIGRDTNGDGFFTERPAFASDLSKPNLVRTEYGILDPNPSPGDAIIPRNFGKGSATFNLDTLVSKTFKFGTVKNNPKSGKYGLSFSVYIRNTLNTVNQGNPIGNMSSPNFLRRVSYNSDVSNIISSNGMEFGGFGGRSFNFSTGFRF